jgi:tetratricopeptide (TPR) repeat protein
VPSTLRPDLKLDLQSITAPFHQRGSQELLALAHDHGFAPAQLRRAYIYTKTRQTQRAVSMLSALLRGPPRPSPAVESHAFYLRALAYSLQGRKQQAIADCRRAAALAMDPGLRSATEGMLRQHDVSAVAKAEADTPMALQIRGRAGWGADPSKRNIEAMGRIYRITVHHSANLARSPSLREAVRAIKLDQRYHMRTKGWADIGYHYLIDPAGRIWEGRDLRWQGAHAGNRSLNRGNIGVCLLGNFIGGRTGQAPGNDQVLALKALLQYLSRKHRIQQHNIFTHRELQGVVTVCPGLRLQRVINRLRRGMVAAAPTSHSPAGGDE